MITNLTVYRDRRNEKPCKQDDPFSVAVPVQVTCEHRGYFKAQTVYQIYATVTENVDPLDVFLKSGEISFVKRYLFKKGEEIDLTEEERNKVIEAFESRKQES